MFLGRLSIINKFVTVVCVHQRLAVGAALALWLQFDPRTGCPLQPAIMPPSSGLLAFMHLESVVWDPHYVHHLLHATCINEVDVDGVRSLWAAWSVQRRAGAKIENHALC